MSYRFAGIARASAVAAPFVLAFAAYLATLAIMQPETAGDEQHYLLAAGSLAFDGDFDLENDYASRERTLAVSNFFPQAPHAFRYEPSGGLYPFHGLGLSVLLAPAVGLGGVTLARLVMVLIAALLADQLYRLLAELGIARPKHRWLAWIAVAACLPLVAFSNQVYPEVPGALLVLVVLRVAILPRPGTSALLLASVASALLPWLHVRYLPISAFLLVGLAYAACRADRRATRPDVRFVARAWSSVRACAVELGGPRRRVGAAIVVPHVVTLVGLAAVFEVLYGSPLPSAPYRPLAVGGVGSAGWTFWYDYLLAYFLHPADGWIPYAPVHWLGIAGVAVLGWRLGGPALAVALAVFMQLALVASTGLAAGFGFPGRFVVVFLPLVAVPLALVIEAVREARLVFYPLLAVSLVIAASAVLDHASLYPLAVDRHYPARLFAVRSIQTAFPETRQADVVTSAAVRPGAVRPEVGRVTGDRVVASEAAGDGPGFVLFGTYAVLPSGLYRATFALAVRGGGGDAVARVEVVTTPERVIAERPVAAGDVGPGPALTNIVLNFGTPGRIPIDARVFFEGRGELEVGPIEVAAEPGTVPPPERFPDWPLAFLWVAGTAFVGLLLTRVARRP